MTEMMVIGVDYATFDWISRGTHQVKGWHQKEGEVAANLRTVTQHIGEI